MILIPIIAALSMAAPQDVDRIAICHDGNLHDHDDIGAIAMSEALVWRANQLGIPIELVHLDHSSHLWETDEDQYEDMVISATRWLHHFGIDESVVFDDVMNLRNAVYHMGEMIEASTAEDELTIIQGGPWEVMAKGFDASDPATHQYVKIISHSTWNNDHQHDSSHRTKDEFFAQYDAGGKWQDFLPPSYEKISDQNQYAFRSDISQWSWLLNNFFTSFVFNRTLAASGSAQGDMSDAGMLFYFLTKIEQPTMNDVQDFFGV